MGDTKFIPLNNRSLLSSNKPAREIEGGMSAMKECPTNPKQPKDNLPLILAILTVIPTACNQLLDATDKLLRILQLF